MGGEEREKQREEEREKPSLFFCSQESNKSDRGRQIPHARTYMCNLKKQRNKLIGTENRLVVARGKGWGWAKWVKGVKGTDFQL